MFVEHANCIRVCVFGLNVGWFSSLPVIYLCIHNIGIQLRYLPFTNHLAKCNFYRKKNWAKWHFQQGFLVKANVHGNKTHKLCTSIIKLLALAKWRWSLTFRRINVEKWNIPWCQDILYATATDLCLISANLFQIAYNNSTFASIF